MAANLRGDSKELMIPPHRLRVLHSLFCPFQDYSKAGSQLLLSQHFNTSQCKAARVVEDSAVRLYLIDHRGYNINDVTSQFGVAALQQLHGDLSVC